MRQDNERGRASGMVQITLSSCVEDHMTRKENFIGPVPLTIRSDTRADLRMGSDKDEERGVTVPKREGRERRFVEAGEGTGYIHGFRMYYRCAQ